VQQLVRQLLRALEAQERAAHHQQRRDQPGHEGADQQRRRHQDGLVDQRALGHRPDHRELAVGLHAGDLLRVERQVVAQHAGGLLGGHLAENRHVVQHGGDVVDEGKQTAGGHGQWPVVRRPTQCGHAPCSTFGMASSRPITTRAYR
jgi:hypothetical protein